MGKIKVKFAFALVFCVLSCFFVFAEDEDGDNLLPQPQSSDSSGSGNTENTGATSAAKNNSPPAPSPVKYTVTFDAGNGNIIAAKQIKSGDSLKELLPLSLEKTGYRFDGWFTTESGGGTQFHPDTPVRDNITIYARWTSWESIRISKLEEEIGELKTGIKNTASTLFLSLVVTGIFTLVLTALSIILLLSVKSAKNEMRRLDAKSEDKYAQIYHDFTQKFADITEKPPHGPSTNRSSSFDSSAKEEYDKIYNDFIQKFTILRNIYG
jgi:uncharacterized repeat protein (TIGR02543 family)